MSAPKIAMTELDILDPQWVVCDAKGGVVATTHTRATAQQLVEEFDNLAFYARFDGRRKTYRPEPTGVAEGVATVVRHGGGSIALVLTLPLQSIGADIGDKVRFRISMPEETPAEEEE